MANITRFNPFNERTRFDPITDMSSMLNWMTLRAGLRGLTSGHVPSAFVERRSES